MWVVHAIISLLLGVIGTNGSKDPTLEALLKDNAALRKENADLREENAATAFRRVQGDFRRRLQDSKNTTDAVVNPYWKVTSGDCVADLECLTSPAYPDNYPDDATCTVDILGGWSGYLDVEVLELELFWDYLWVNEQSFTGSADGVAIGLQGLELVPNDTITFTADHTNSAAGFKLCRSLVQVTVNVTQVPTTQINPASSSFNEFWGVADGGCYLDTSGCINSPNYPIQYLASGTCEIHITDSWNGGTLLFDYFGTEDGWDMLYVNGEGYSGGDLDDVDELQGVVPTTRILWCPDDNTEEKGWKVCRDERVEKEWNNWTCTMTGAACTNFSTIYPTDACTTLYSDEYDVDDDGLFHSGHPYCWVEDSTGYLVKTVCGPCSCLAGEEETTVSRTLGTGWNTYEYIECNACSPGRYRSEGGYGVDPLCSLCDTGYHASGVGATACDLCLAGSAAGQNGTECVVCTPGTYSEQDGASVCQGCTPGHHNADAGALSCEQCDPGKYSLESASTCEECTVGYYGDAAGLSVCQACSAGFYASIPGHTACDPCPPGTRSGDIASSLCPQCEAGECSGGGNSTSCTNCGIGNLTDDPGVTERASTSCANCGIGNLTDDPGVTERDSTSGAAFSNHRLFLSVWLGVALSLSASTSDTLVGHCLVTAAVRSFVRHFSGRAFFGFE